jgi:fructose-1,6-bisphosphatase
MEDHKVDKIKTIYQSQQEPKQPKQESTFLQLHSDKIDLMTLKNETSIKNLEKLIKIKEIEVLKELNKKRNHSFVRKSEDSSAREGKG